MDKIICDVCGTSYPDSASQFVPKKQNLLPMLMLAISPCEEVASPVAMSRERAPANLLEDSLLPPKRNRSLEVPI